MKSALLLAFVEAAIRDNPELFQKPARHHTLWMDEAQHFDRCDVYAVPRRQHTHPLNPGKRKEKRGRR